MKKALVIIVFTIFVVVSGCSKRPARSTSTHSPHFHESKVSFNSSISLKGGETNLIQPHILQDKEGILYATWVKGEAIFLSRSFDNGKNWEGKSLDLGAQLLEQRSHSKFCLEQDSQGNLCLVQHIHYPGIFFSMSNDKGENWIRNIQVNDDRRKFAYCGNPSLCISKENDIFIAYTKRKTMDEIDPWKEEEEATAAVYFSKSSDGGKTWEKSIHIEGTEGRGYSVGRPILAGDSRENLYLFCRRRLYKSTDTGESWELVKSDLGTDTIGKNRFRVDSQGNLYFVWIERKVTGKEGNLVSGGKESGYTEVCFSKSENGKTWSLPVRINDTELPFESGMPPFNVTGTEYIKKYATQETGKADLFDLAVSRNAEIIGIIWKDWRSGKGNIYFSYSLDRGKCWAKNVKLNEDFAQETKTGSLTIKKDGSIYVLWTNLGSHKSIPGGFIGDVNVYFSSGNVEKS